MNIQKITIEVGDSRTSPVSRSEKTLTAKSRDIVLFEEFLPSGNYLDTLLSNIEVLAYFSFEGYSRISIHLILLLSKIISHIMLCSFRC